MKEFLIVLLSVFTAFCYGQGLNGELGFNNDYNQISRGVVCADEFSYFVEQQGISNSFFTTCSLIKTDTLENVIWEVPISPIFAETYDVYEIISSENGGVYVLGFGIPTCDVGADCFWFIQKINSSGIEEWNKMWTDSACWEYEMSGLSLDSNNDILINYSDNSVSKIYTLSNTGNLTDSLEIPSNQLSEIELSSTFEFIASRYDKLLGYNVVGTIQDSVSFTSQISDFITVNDTLYVTTSDSIFSFESDFTPIAATDILGYTDYSHLKSYDDSLSFISHSTNNQNILNINHDLQLLSALQIPIDLYSIDPKDFNQKHFTSTSNFLITSNKKVIRHLDHSLESSTDTFVNWTDIGIIDLDATQINVVANQQVQNIYQVDISADVLIKNFGSNVLNDCRINHYIGVGIACGTYYYTEMFSNLNLAPGDSMWISLGLIHSEENYFPADTLERMICVYTSHPNHKTDLSVPNDQYCENVIIGYANINEINVSDKQLVKIVDLMGRETDKKLNTLQIYIYSDGTTEKVFRVE